MYTKIINVPIIRKSRRPQVVPPREITVSIRCPDSIVHHKLNHHQTQRLDDAFKKHIFKKFDLSDHELSLIDLDHEQAPFDATGNSYMITRIIFNYMDKEGQAIFDKVTQNPWWRSLTKKNTTVI